MKLLLGVTLLLFLSLPVNASKQEEVRIPLPSVQSDSPKRSFSFEDELTVQVAKRIAESFSKKVLFFDDLGDARVSVDLKDVTFREAYNLILYPIGYRFKEFDNGLIVIAKVCDE